jgi:hypothetical protein
MAFQVVAIPVLPGKSEQLDSFVGQLNGERKRDFQESRRRLGIRERAFRQRTPQGEVVILAIEGDDPMGAFSRFGAGSDEFTRWFVQQVREIHGLDLTQPPPGPPPTLMVDSEGG